MDIGELDELVERLAQDEMEKPTIAIDFDGTIAQTNGWEYPEMGPPFDGVAEAIEQLRDKGYRILIYTCRLNKHNEDNDTSEEELERMTNYLDQAGIPFDDFVMAEVGKPFANYYVDDKAIRFEGDWEETIDFIDSLELHNNSRKAVERVFQRAVLALPG